MIDKKTAEIFQKMLEWKLEKGGEEKEIPIGKYKVKLSRVMDTDELWSGVALIDVDGLQGFLGNRHSDRDLGDASVFDLFYCSERHRKGFELYLFGKQIFATMEVKMIIHKEVVRFSEYRLVTGSGRSFYYQPHRLLLLAPTEQITTQYCLGVVQLVKGMKGAYDYDVKNYGIERYEYDYGSASWGDLSEYGTVFFVIASDKKCFEAHQKTKDNKLFRYIVDSRGPRKEEMIG